MKHLLLLLIALVNVLLTVQAVAQAQESKAVPLFNETHSHLVGVGFAVTSFSSSFAYYVTPYYAYRTGRHLISFTPFYGRLDAVAGQQNLGVGFEYRIYPFKNVSRVRYYAPISVHYTYGWLNKRKDHSILYGVGVGSETDLGKSLCLSVDVRFGLGQAIESTRTETSNNVLGSGTDLSYYFLPTIRLAYKL